jgi:hypothetical protein
MAARWRIHTPKITETELQQSNSWPKKFNGDDKTQSRSFASNADHSETTIP